MFRNSYRSHKLKEKPMSHVSVFVVVLFFLIVAFRSEAYSQCLTPPPAAPSGLTLGSTSTVTPTSTTTPTGTASGLVGYWTFDERSGSTACDSSGKGNIGTLTNGPIWAVGKIGGALYFDGIDDNVTVADSNSLDVTSSFTLSAWVNPASSLTDFRSILVKNYKYYLYASTAGYCGSGGLLAGFDEQTSNTLCQATPLPANTWTHLAATYTGSVLTLYRNGVAVATSNITRTLSPTTGTLQIGASQFGENFKGLIDEVRIHNRSLTNSEIQARFQQESVGLLPAAPPAETAPATGSLFSFSLSNSGDKTVVAGSSVSNSISTTLHSVSSQAVSFTVAGLPSGANGSFSSASCTPACSTVLTIITAGSTPVGSFPITVTSTGGGVNKNTAFTLSVTLAMTVATPIINPTGGTFSDVLSLAMQTTTSGASVYYSTDGSEPNESSNLFSGSLTLTSSATVKAKAFKSGYNPSSVASGSFTKAGTGTTFYVARNGSDSYSCNQAQSTATPKQTIRAGISCLAANPINNRIEIRGGSYPERILMSDYPNLNGNSWSDAPVIAAYPGETVVLQPTVDTGIDINRAAQYVIFDRLIIDMSRGSTPSFGIGNSTNPHHIRFQNGEVKNATASGIIVGDKATHFEFINNKVYNNGSGRLDHGFYITTDHNLLERNEVYDNGGYGLHFYSQTSNPSGNIIRYNVVRNNCASGDPSSAGIIISSGGSNNIVYNNIVRNNPCHGIQLSYWVSGIKVYNNTVFNNTHSGIATDATVSNSIIRNNVLYQNGQPIADLGSGTIQSNNLTADPRFIDGAANNFRLQSSSPAINAGVSLSEVLTDFDGIPRPQGSAFDIGSYEYR